MIYKYGYRLRPPVLATEPKGYIKREAFNHKTDGYWGIVFYNRELRDGEVYAYDLDLLEVFNYEKTN